MDAFHTSLPEQEIEDRVAPPTASFSNLWHAFWALLEAHRGDYMDVASHSEQMVMKKLQIVNSL